MKNDTYSDKNYFLLGMLVVNDVGTLDGSSDTTISIRNGTSSTLLDDSELPSVNEDLE